MSKTLDILKQESKKSDPIQEQLAEIYISPTKKKSLSERTKAKSEKTINRGWLGLVLALGVLWVATLLFLFSNNRLNISVTVIQEKAEIEEEKAKETVFLDTAPSPKEKQEGQLVLEGLPPNTIEFGGSASERSRLTDYYLYLVNGRGRAWANAKISFNQPVNAVDNALRFSAKGGKGGELLLVVLKDAGNRTYQSINIAPGGMEKEWQSFAINLNEARSWIDITSISQIRFEFGSLTTDNPATATIYIKELILTKK